MLNIFPLFFCFFLYICAQNVRINVLFDALQHHTVEIAWTSALIVVKHVNVFHRAHMETRMNVRVIEIEKHKMENPSALELNQPSRSVIFIKLLIMLVLYDGRFGLQRNK